MGGAKRSIFTDFGRSKEWGPGGENLQRLQGRSERYYRVSFSVSVAAGAGGASCDSCQASSPIKEEADRASSANETSVVGVPDRAADAAAAAAPLGPRSSTPLSGGGSETEETGSEY